MIGFAVFAAVVAYLYAALRFWRRPHEELLTSHTDERWECDTCGTIIHTENIEQMLTAMSFHDKVLCNAICSLRSEQERHND